MALAVAEAANELAVGSCIVAGDYNLEMDVVMVACGVD